MFGIIKMNMKKTIKDTEHLDSIREMYELYGEPCNNCVNYTGLSCKLSNRTKRFIVDLGHISDVNVRRLGGCPDWQLDETLTKWHGEISLYNVSGDYGGSKTSLI